MLPAISCHCRQNCCKNICKGLWDPCRMLTSHGGGETGSHLRPDKVRLKVAAKGDCYPCPAGEADGAAVSRSSVCAAGGMCHHRCAAEDATHQTLPHQCQTQHTPAASLAGRQAVGWQLPELWSFHALLVAHWADWGDSLWLRWAPRFPRVQGHCLRFAAILPHLPCLP